MTYKKGNYAEFGPVDVFQFKTDSVKPFSCVRIKVVIIMIIIIIIIIIIIPRPGNTGTPRPGNTGLMSSWG